MRTRTTTRRGQENDAKGMNERGITAWMDAGEALVVVVVDGERGDGVDVGDDFVPPENAGTVGR